MKTLPLALLRLLWYGKPRLICCPKTKGLRKQRELKAASGSQRKRHEPMQLEEHDRRRSTLKASLGRFLGSPKLQGPALWRQGISSKVWALDLRSQESEGYAKARVANLGVPDG